MERGGGGFIGASNDFLTVISTCPQTGRARAQQVCAATAMAAGSSSKTAINGFGRIGRNVLRCWLLREEKPFDIVAINVGSMGDKVFKVVNGRDPAAMPWKHMDVEIIIESTGAFNSLDGGAKHLEAGAKKVVLT